MRKIWILGVMVGMFVVVAVVASCSRGGKRAEVQVAAEIPTEWATFEKGEFLVRYPAGWEMVENFEGTVFCLFSVLESPSDGFRENVNLAVEELTAELSLDKYVSLSLRGLRGKYEVTDGKKYVVDGQEYYRLKLKEKERLYQEQHYFIKGKKVYILTFSYEPKEKEEIIEEGNKIMSSFRIK